MFVGYLILPFFIFQHTRVSKIDKTNLHIFFEHSASLIQTIQYLAAPVLMFQTSLVTLYMEYYSLIVCETFTVTGLFNSIYCLYLQVQ